MILDCPHCQQPVFRRNESGTKLKLARSVVVLNKAGDIEVNCPRCRRGIVIGQVGTALKKASPRLVVRPFPEGT